MRDAARPAFPSAFETRFAVRAQRSDVTVILRRFATMYQIPFEIPSYTYDVAM